MSKRFHPLLASVAIAAIGMLYVPMIAVAAFSVNANRRGYTWTGFTTHWYREMFSRDELISAAVNSLILAVVSTAISTLIGTLLALGVSRYPWKQRARGVLHFLIILPVVTPDIVFAAAMVVAFAMLRQLSGIFNPSMATMVVAHVTFQIAFVTMVVQSRLATFDRVLEEAARDLYADSWYLTRRVMLPLLMPGIVAGAMLAFTLSLDDFVISFFTAGPDSVTLPLRIHAEARQGRVSPETNALSTLVFLLTVVAVLGVERLTRKEGRRA